MLVRTALALLVSAGSVLPAAASSGTDGAFSDIRLHVTPDCTVPLAPALPLSPTAVSGCEGAPLAGTTAAGAGSLPPGPCVAVVPLVDNRCEAWTSRYDGPAGGTDAPAGELAGSLLVAASPDSK